MGKSASRSFNAYVSTFLECCLYASQRNDVPASDAFAATGLGLPRRSSSDDFGPERIGSTLVGPYRVDSASVRRVQKDAAASASATNTLSGIVHVDDISTPKPLPGDAEKPADSLLFPAIGGDVVLVLVSDTARAAAGAFETQLLFTTEHTACVAGKLVTNVDSDIPLYAELGWLALADMLLYAPERCNKWMHCNVRWR